MTKPEFNIDYHVDVPIFDVAMQNEVKERLLDLVGDHTDMIGAAVAVTQPTESSSPKAYQARIVVYTRPNDIVAIKKDETLSGALKDALDAIERQVREKRDKLGQPWKRADIPGTSSSSPAHDVGDIDSRVDEEGW